MHFLLGLPYGFSKGGWGLSIIAFPLATIVSIFCIFDLLATQNFVGDKKIRTYGDCGKVAFGNAGYWFVQIVMCIFQIACCCSYMLIISDSLEMLTDWRQEYWAGVMSAFMWLLSFIRYTTLIFIPPHILYSLFVTSPTTIRSLFHFLEQCELPLLSHSVPTSLCLECLYSWLCLEHHPLSSHHLFFF